jgi:hypothetical protein
MASHANSLSKKTRFFFVSIVFALAICAFFMRDCEFGADNNPNASAITFASNQHSSRAPESIDQERSAQFLPSHRRGGLPVVYHASVALKSQIAGLRSAADSGNAYAACVLASALDLCGRRRNDLVMFDYPDGYLTSLSDTQADRFSMAISRREQAMSIMCLGIEPEDLRDVDERLLQSALAGHPASMARLASLPEKSNRGLNITKKQFAIAYREHAEVMLNRAAESGELSAIEQISSAYAMGAITSAMGNLPIKADELKFLAASHALTLIRDDLKKRRLPVDYFDDQELRVTIRSRMAGMRKEELSRFSRLTSTYYRAYRARYAESDDNFAPLDELPERACASVEATLNKPTKSTALR